MNSDLDPKDPISKVTTVVTSDLVTTTPISNVTTVVTSPGISSASSLSGSTVNFTPTAPLLLTASAKKDNPLSPASKKKNKNDADKKGDKNKGHSHALSLLKMFSYPPTKKLLCLLKVLRWLRLLGFI